MVQNQAGETALHWAVEWRQLPIVQILLDAAGSRGIANVCDTKQVLCVIHVLAIMHLTAAHGCEHIGLSAAQSRCWVSLRCQVMNARQCALHRLSAVV